jgi:hypothetical protein
MKRKNKENKRSSTARCGAQQGEGKKEALTAK